VLDPTDAAPAPSPAAAQPPDPTRRRLAAGVAASVVVAAAGLVVDAVRPDGPPSSPPGAWTLVPHRGLGAWVDVYDWTVELGGDAPAVDEDDIDEMADAGVQTLYLQTSSRRSRARVMEQERLQGLVDRAHERGLHVVAWYLPTLVDLDEELRRLEAAAALRVDGLGVDIEATDVADPAERTRRLLELSDRLRQSVGDGKALAAITLSSVHVEVVNPAFWPAYPWAELAERYDVLMPMAYWTIRRGDLRAGERYVAENLARIRAAVGAAVPIHPIGGIADAASTADLEGFGAAAEDGGAVGASLYDWATSTPQQWQVLRPLAGLRQAAG
jgi:hypothetical protein